VALTPRGPADLVARGHEVVVERGAGGAAGFTDEDYEAVGVKVAHRRIEALARGELLVGVRWLDPTDTSVVAEGTVALSLHRLGLAAAVVRKAYREAGIVSISGDRLRHGNGRYPVIERMSELGGALAPQIAARLLESTAPGRTGVLLTRLPGVSPAEVVIVGAGTLGSTAARAFAGLGASVHLLDIDLWRLNDLAPTLPANVVSLVATPDIIEHMVRFANVLITAVRTPGRRPPQVIGEEHLRLMRRGAVVMDFSIDEGGAVQTARPIWDAADAYEVHGVLHFSMPNTPSLVARTASRMLSQVYLPFVQMLADGAHPTAHPSFSPAVWWGDDAFDGEPPVDGLAFAEGEDRS